jgi:hypothetical protein
MRIRRVLILVAALLGATVAEIATAGHVGPGPTGGVDVKVIADNNNVPGGVPTPGFDALNDAQNETSVAISPVNASIVAVVANDYRMLQVLFLAWVGLYVSNDEGTSWFNTFTPGFRTDATAAGAASSIKGLANSGDPAVRFDASGNLYVSALAYIPTPEWGVQPDTVVYIAKYNYTPGTPGGVSTFTSAGNPPNFTYAFTTIVDRGSVLFSPGIGRRAHGRLDDKPWLAIDTTPSSPCFGTIYFAFASIHAEPTGSIPIVLSRSTDGGATFSEPRPITVKGQDGSVSTQGASLSVATDGTLHVAYSSFATPDDSESDVRAVRSDDCGRTFTKPVTVAPFRRIFFSTFFVPRVPQFPQVAVDDLNPDIVYVTFASRSGVPIDDADILVARSADRGDTWGEPARVNDDSTGKTQFFPTIAVSKGAVHVAWYDLRESTLGQRIMNVYYASSNTSGVPYPLFSHNVRVTDVGSNPDCNLLLTEAGPFIGDYIELDARFDGANHIVHLAWADNRDINPCVPAGIPFPPIPQSQGVFNQNVYADRLVVAP